jgi:hypothetical protein
MRRSVIGGGLVSLLVGLGMAAAAGPHGPDTAPWRSSAGPSVRPSEQPPSGNQGLFRRWFGGSKQAAAQEPAAPEKAGAPSPPTAASPAPKPANAAADQPRDASAMRQREENAWLRRQAVCRKLLEIALETNDGELQRMAEQLDERVWAAYVQRTAHLPAGRATMFEGDEKILEKHLQPDALTSRPAPPTPQAAKDSERGGRAAVVEGKR